MKKFRRFEFEDGTVIYTRGMDRVEKQNAILKYGKIISISKPIY